MNFSLSLGDNLSVWQDELSPSPFPCGIGITPKRTSFSISGTVAEREQFAEVSPVIKGNEFHFPNDRNLCFIIIKFLFFNGWESE